PDPERPVKTISLSRGSSTSTLRRLCSRAPRMRIDPPTVGQGTRSRRSSNGRSEAENSRPDVGPGGRAPIEAVERVMWIHPHQDPHSVAVSVTDQPRVTVRQTIHLHRRSREFTAHPDPPRHERTEPR